MTKNIIIFHGTMGSPEGNWVPWLASEMLERDYEVFIPALPTPDNQNLESWLKAAQRFDMNEETILIGHSCGATLLLHLLAQLKRSLKKAILVSPVTDIINIPDYDALNASFIAPHLNADTFSSILHYVKLNNMRLDLFYGDNDPYVPQKQPETLAKELGIKPHIIKGGGHLNAESGYTEFSELLEFVVD